MQFTFPILSQKMMRVQVFDYIHPETKIWYVVENVLKPHDVKCFCSDLRTYADIPSCFSSKSTSC